MKSLKLLLVEQILEHKYNITSDKILGVCEFGSATYGTQTEKSDYDFVAIVDMDDGYIQFESPDVDIHIMSKHHYLSKLESHDIMALEVHFNPSPLKKYEVDFTINKVKLRHKISAVVSNSWVKAKKKVNLENEDTWTGYKSLFHSIRILDFGIQMAAHGQIVDYKCSTHVWDEILEKVGAGVEFDEIMEYYKPKHNNKATFFRELAPKE